MNFRKLIAKTDKIHILNFHIFKLEAINWKIGKLLMANVAIAQK